MKRLLIILVITLSIYSLLASVEINAFDSNYYLQSYNKYNVSKTSGKTSQELLNVTLDLHSYLKGKSNEDVLESNFNQEEILHLKDVKILFKYGFILKYISLFLAIISLSILLINKMDRIIGKYIYYGFFINWSFLLILLLLVFLDFDKYFTYFHLIFFRNDLWLLNPKTDLLIQMLPEEFFIGMAKKIALSFFKYLAIIQSIGYLLMKKGRERFE